MGFFDNAQEVLDRGVSAAKGAVSGVAVEQQAFVKGFARLCSEGSSQGWHESNGGNASYRLAPEDVASSRSFFYDNPSSWVPLGVQAANLGGEFFLAAIQSVRKEATGGTGRVLYHAHPANVVALTNVLPLDARTFTRALWKMLMEAMIAFPKGIGVVPWMVPGGPEIASATADAMRVYDACVWAHHGLFCAGNDFDSTFGLAQTIDKAATVYAQARAMNGGSDRFASAIPDEGLRGIAEAYHLPVNEAFLA